jgi:ribosomal-protein-alanine N-acetyltransferase
MPVLETARLRIRPFTLTDLDDVYRLLDVELGWHAAEPGEDVRDARRAWLAWSVANYAALAALRQPPYGDRAVVLKDSGRLVGVAGLVPCLMPFGLLPSFGGAPDPATVLSRPEVGLFWAVAAEYRRQGFATEAGRALVGYAFGRLRLQRIVATTERDNLASQGVMRALGMRVEANPFPQPPWLQVVGSLENGSS